MVVFVGSLVRWVDGLNSCVGTISSLPKHLSNRWCRAVLFLLLYYKGMQQSLIFFGISIIMLF